MRKQQFWTEIGGLPDLRSCGEAAGCSEASVGATSTVKAGGKSAKVGKAGGWTLSACGFVACWLMVLWWAWQTLSSPCCRCIGSPAGETCISMGVEPCPRLLHSEAASATCANSNAHSDRITVMMRKRRVALMAEAGSLSDCCRLRLR